MTHERGMWLPWGEVLSDAVLEYLKTGVYPSNSVVGPVWVEGETMKTERKT